MIIQSIVNTGRPANLSNLTKLVDSGNQEPKDGFQKQDPVPPHRSSLLSHHATVAFVGSGFVTGGNLGMHWAHSLPAEYATAVIVGGSLVGLAGGLVAAHANRAVADQATNHPTLANRSCAFAMQGLAFGALGVGAAAASHPGELTAKVASSFLAGGAAIGVTSGLAITGVDAVSRRLQQN